jgi:hypothetical protein
LQQPPEGPAFAEKGFALSSLELGSPTFLSEHMKILMRCDLVSNDSFTLISGLELQMTAP